jgi:hypothetical protein
MLDTHVRSSAALLAGFVAASVMRYMHQRSCRHCVKYEWPGDPRPLPWYSPGIVALGIIAIAVGDGRTRPSPALDLIAVVVVISCVVAVIRSIVKQLQQFPPQCFFLTTAIIAALCSACYYLHVAWFIVFWVLPGLEWSKQSLCRRRLLEIRNDGKPAIEINTRPRAEQRTKIQRGALAYISLYFVMLAIAIWLLWFER